MATIFFFFAWYIVTKLNLLTTFQSPNGWPDPSPLGQLCCVQGAQQHRHRPPSAGPVQEQVQRAGAEREAAALPWAAEKVNALFYQYLTLEFLIIYFLFYLYLTRIGLIEILTFSFSRESWPKNGNSTVTDNF